MSRFLFYDKAAIGYVNAANSTEKSDAVTYADNQSGAWDWNSSYSNTTTWNCAKLVMKAYDDATDGDVLLYLNYHTPPYLLLPNHIYYDNETTIYTTSSAVSNEKLPQHAQERLDRWEERGIDTSEIRFQSGIHKDGFPEYLLTLKEESIESGISEKSFIEAIINEYKITTEQYQHILQDVKPSGF